MTNRLENKRIAFLVANEGVEQIELTNPWARLSDEGADLTLVAPELGKVQCFEHLTAADTVEATVAVAAASADDYDALVLPGGVANPDQLRTNDDAVEFVRSFFAAGKPVAAICHAPWILVEASRVKGRRLTSWPSLQTDIRNAGGTWVDEEVVVCDAEAAVLVTSRKPQDLDAFNDATVDAIASD